MNYIDTQKIRDMNDCREIIAQDIGMPRSRGGQSWAWKCPMHNEQSGQALTATRSTWRCWGKCGVGGDVIEWRMRFYNISFKEACESFSNQRVPMRAFARSGKPNTSQSEPPDIDWQKNARTVIQIGQENLHSPRGVRALKYLLQDRGLTLETIQTAKLGYIPGLPNEWKAILPNWTRKSGDSEVTCVVPCGILIPHIHNEVIWNVRVRRAKVTERNSKYVSIGGGRAMLYWSDRVERGMPLLIVEGEFDALIAWQYGHDLVSPVALVSAAYKNINRRWWKYLVSAPQILTRFDSDAAGRSASASLQDISNRCRDIQVPHGNDINDFVLQTSNMQTIEQAIREFRAWLNESLTPNKSETGD